MFKFNFEVEDKTDKTLDEEHSTCTESSCRSRMEEDSYSSETAAYKLQVTARIVNVDWTSLTLSSKTRKVKLRSSDSSLIVVQPIEEDYVSKTTEINSKRPRTAWEVASEKRDVLPGVYEGGLALWECALDLTSWLDSNQSHVKITSKSRVLELGCGFGLPGIWALKEGCGTCVFQDLNQSVLATATAQHVLANFGSDALSRAPSRIRMISGDWFDENLLSLLEMPASCGDEELEATSYDVIISAETLYTPALTTRLHRILGRLLRPKTGIAVVAAKRFYFGSSLGGGTGLFCSLCERPGSPLAAKVVGVFEDGSSNIREVLFVSHRGQGGSHS